MPSNKPLHHLHHKHTSPDQSLSPANLSGSLTKTLRSAKATEALGWAISQSLCGGEVIALTGELGTGKTVLVRGIAIGLGIPPEQVTSPTFTLIHEYRGRLRLIHADLYRIKNQAELEHIGFHEYYSPSTIVVAEWAERMGQELPLDHLSIHLTHIGTASRLATMTSCGSQSQALLQNLTS